MSMAKTEEQAVGSRDNRSRDHSMFAREGYCVLEGFLPALAVEQLKAAIETKLSMPVDEGCVRPNNTLVPLVWDDEIVRRCLADGHSLHRLAESVGASDLRWISGYISIKDAHSAPLDWHQDWWCWDHPVSFTRRTTQLAVLCYLTETSSENAALRVLPRTHHHFVPLHADLPAAHADGPDRSSGDDQPNQVTLAVAAGDAIVIDYRLLHSTHENRTDQRRDCVLLSFTPNWRGLPPDIRGHLIQHPAQPVDRDPTDRKSRRDRLLPFFDGALRDLSLNRVPPTDFLMLD